MTGLTRMLRHAFIVAALLLAGLPACSKCDVPTYGFWNGGMTACTEKQR